MGTTAVTEAVVFEFDVKADKAYAEISRLHAAALNPSAAATQPLIDNIAKAATQAATQATVAANQQVVAHKEIYDETRRTTQEFAKQDEHAGSILQRMALAAREARLEKRQSGEMVLERTLSSPTRALDLGADMIGQGMNMMIAGVVGEQLKVATEKMVEMRNQLRAGKIDAAEFAMQFAESIPVLGSFVSFFNNIRELITGEKAQLEVVKGETIAIDIAAEHSKAGFDAIKESARETADLLRRARGEMALMGVEGPHREQIQALNEYNDAIATAEKKRDDSMKKAADDAVAAKRKIAEQEEIKALIHSRPSELELDRAKSIEESEGQLDPFENSTAFKSSAAIRLKAAEAIRDRERAYQIATTKAQAIIDKDAAASKIEAQKAYDSEVQVAQEKLQKSTATQLEKLNREQAETNKKLDAEVHAAKMKLYENERVVGRQQLEEQNREALAAAEKRDREQTAAGITGAGGEAAKQRELNLAKLALYDKETEHQQAQLKFQRDEATLSAEASRKAAQYRAQDREEDAREVERKERQRAELAAAEEKYRQDKYAHPYDGDLFRNDERIISEMKQRHITEDTAHERAQNQQVTDAKMAATVAELRARRQGDLAAHMERLAQMEREVREAGGNEEKVTAIRRKFAAEEAEAKIAVSDKIADAHEQALEARMRAKGQENDTRVASMKYQEEVELKNSGGNEELQAAIRDKYAALAQEMLSPNSRGRFQAVDSHATIAGTSAEQSLKLQADSLATLRQIATNTSSTQGAVAQ